MNILRTEKPGRRGSALLHRRHQQADQHRDDRDDHQELDERETRPSTKIASHKSGLLVRDGKKWCFFCFSEQPNMSGREGWPPRWEPRIEGWQDLAMRMA